MHTILAVTLTLLFALGLVFLRVVFGASQLAAGAALGRFKLPASWQRWLLGERRSQS